MCSNWQDDSDNMFPYYEDDTRRDGGIDVKSRRKISLKALDFRAFAGLEEKQLRGAESSVETYPRLSSNALEE